MARESMVNGGKKIRPILVLLSCEAVSKSKDYKLALPAAIIYELSHTAALIQDDILDKATFRRKRKSVWKKYGLENAILISDILLFEMFSKLIEYEKLGLPEERIYKLLAVIGETAKDATRGEFMDRQLGIRSDMSTDEYLKMIELKTGSLLRGACKSGAIVGGGTGEEINKLGNFGSSIGKAYQIRDDILDVIADKNKVGKPVFQDLRNNKKNIVIIHALNNANARDKKFLTGLLKKGNISPNDITLARKLFQKSGSVEYAESLAAKISTEGRRYLNPIKDSKAKEKLIKLSHHAERRMY